MRILDGFEQRAAGEAALDLMRRLFAVPRSLTGDGNRTALEMMTSALPDIERVEVPSGTDVFDWTVPPEWNLRRAILWAPDGSVIADSKDSPLSVMGYSTPIEGSLTLDELEPHLHSLPDRPQAIPYRTSYYTPDWGFCLPHALRSSLPAGDYRVLIDSTLDPAGSLTYGAASMGGDATTGAFLVSAHMCHPAQANDNLSGMVVLAGVAAQAASRPPGMELRPLLLPGGIGSIVWLHQNPDLAARNLGGLSLACLGDPSGLSYKATRRGDTIVDRAAALAAADMGLDLTVRGFDPYGFDERNFSSPGFDLAYGSVTRAPHGGYPEYHSSDDDLTLMDAARLGEAMEYVLRIIGIVDANRLYRRREPRGEPQLGKRGLYGAVGGTRSKSLFETALLWVANLADGTHDLVAAAERSGLPFEDVVKAADALVAAGVIYDAGQAASQSTSR